MFLHISSVLSKKSYVSTQNIDKSSALYKSTKICNKEHKLLLYQS